MLASATEHLLLDDGQRVNRVIGQEDGAMRLVAALAAVGRLLDAEVGGDLVLEAKLPRPGARRVVAPKAAVGDGKRGVIPAFLVDVARPVAHGEVRPVVILLALPGGELAPPFLRVLPLRGEQRPQGGAVDHDAVVEVRGVADILSLAALVVRWRRALLGALLDGGDEGDQLVSCLEHDSEALLGDARGLLVLAVTGSAEVGELAIDACEGGIQMVGEERAQSRVVPAVDRDPGDEGPLLGRYRPVDRPVVVHLAVELKKLVGEVAAQVAAAGDRRAVLLPGAHNPARCRVPEAVAVIAGVEGGVDEEDPVREGVREIVLARVENALAVRAEPPQRDAEGEREMIGHRLGVVLRGVNRERSALGTIDGRLGPLLGVSPR
ncbi:hypothetical protein OV079_49370 [Nannocystis pusilla]|uniref:Uncharacterized protein n=1 Tax=Nannocystis pusilla TaxID=889268 RepID=A0A9X3F0B1_9BACT|nr:hypothetical protein [Nannocystis pusilla]MCY1013411.1 hypothetical protein [Nannocystis pusilla]